MLCDITYEPAGLVWGLTAADQIRTSIRRKEKMIFQEGIHLHSMTSYSPSAAWPKHGLWGNQRWVKE